MKEEKGERICLGGENCRHHPKQGIKVNATTYRTNRHHTPTAGEVSMNDHSIYDTLAKNTEPETKQRTNTNQETFYKITSLYTSKFSKSCKSKEKKEWPQVERAEKDKTTKHYV